MHSRAKSHSFGEKFLAGKAIRILFSKTRYIPLGTIRCNPRSVSRLTMPIIVECISALLRKSRHCCNHNRSVGRPAGRSVDRSIGLLFGRPRLLFARGATQKCESLLCEGDAFKSRGMLTTYTSFMNGYDACPESRLTRRCSACRRRK